MDLKNACMATKCILLAFGFAFSSLATMIPYVKNRLEVDDAQLGSLLLCSGFGALISMPIAGLLIRKFGSRSVTLISCLIVAIVLPLLTIIRSPYLFAVALFLFGIGTGGLNVSINSHAVALEKKAEVPLMSGFHCLFSFGGLMGAIIVTSLLEWGCSLFLSVLVVALSIAFLLLSQWGNLLSKEMEVRPAEEKKTLCWPEGKVFLLGVICFIAFASEGSVLDWSAEFLHSELGYELSISGIGYAIFSISMAFGRLIGDYLNRRFGSITVFRMSALLSASGFILTFCLQIPYGALLGFCFIGLGASNLVPIIFTASGNTVKTPPAISLTVVTSVAYLGALFGPAFVGFLADATSLSFAMTCIGFGVGVVALCAPIIKTEPKRAII